MTQDIFKITFKNKATDQINIFNNIKDARKFFKKQKSNHYLKIETEFIPTGETRIFWCPDPTNNKNIKKAYRDILCYDTWPL